MKALWVRLRRLFSFHPRSDRSGHTPGNESDGSKPRDHAHQRRHFWKHAHRDWRVWVALVLMIVAIGIYVLTDSLSLRPGKRAVQPTPEALSP